jgi:hypothetical protein
VGLGEGWRGAVVDGWVSPSYGVKWQSPCLEFGHEGPPTSLTVTIEAE